MNLAALRTHHLLDLAEAVASRHDVPVAEVGEPGPAHREFWAALRAEGWGTKNIERVFGVVEPLPLEVPLVDETEDEEPEEPAPARAPAWRPAQAVRPREPGAVPVVRLRVVRVTEIASGTDMFRCLPYAAVLSASTCAERQAAHGTQRASNHGARGSYRDFGKCRNCELGRGVASRLRAAAAVEPAEAAE